MELIIILTHLARLVQPEVQRLMKEDKMLDYPHAYALAIGITTQRYGEATKLSERELIIYETMLQLQKRNGGKPLLRGGIEIEIAFTHAGLKLSPSTLNRALHALENKQLVRQLDRTWLAIRIETPVQSAKQARKAA
jgi:hypothetical protein